MTIRYNGSIIAGSGGGGANPDETTIDLNSEEKLEALGTINKNTSSSIDSMYNWIGTLAEYTSQNIETLHPEWICFITDDVTTHTPPSRNLGEIVQSIVPLTDAGLHLLDGSLISGSGSYSAFVDYISGLVSTYPDLFETEANWQSSVSTYGVCGKFVYDSVNNTIRLPKYSNKIYTSDFANTVGVVGNGKGIGLTDGTQYCGIKYSTTQYYAAYAPSADGYGKDVGDACTAGAGSMNQLKVLGITTDETKSGIIADLSNITTALDGYYYICIATSAKTQIEVDIDEIATDLNGKADIDLSNITSIASILGMIQNTDSSKVGYVYSTYVTTADVYAPAGGKWLVLMNEQANSNTAVVYKFSSYILYPVGSIVDGGTKVATYTSPYNLHVMLLKIA